MTTINRIELRIRKSRAGRSGFTLIELLVVIAIMGLLAGLIVGLSKHAGTTSKHTRIRTELNQLVTAIEAYKAKFGHYPPDHIVSRPPTTPYFVVNPVTNSLFYELTGTILTNNQFRTPNLDERIDSGTIESFFGAEGFVNSSTDPKKIKSFIDLKSTQYKEISSNPDVEVLVVSAAPWPLRDPDFTSPVGPPVAQANRVNPWRYVSTNPTNNPGAFDLWAEFVEGRRVRIISNWSKDIQDRP